MCESSVSGLCGSLNNFSNATNNRLESHNQKTKYPHIFHSPKVWKLVEIKQKKEGVRFFNSDCCYTTKDLSDEANLINSVCTPYTTGLVLNELKLSRSVKYAISATKDGHIVEHNQKVASCGKQLMQLHLLLQQCTTMSSCIFIEIE